LQVFGLSPILVVVIAWNLSNLGSEGVTTEGC
jgi:hypothetical protein